MCTYLGAGQGVTFRSHSGAGDVVASYLGQLRPMIRYVSYRKGQLAGWQGGASSSVAYVGEGEAPRGTLHTRARERKKTSQRRTGVV